MGQSAKDVINVLLIEGNRGDARLLGLLLDEAAPRRFSLTWVTTLTEALSRALSHSFQAILLDLSLPDSHGLDALARLRALHPNLPVIVLTGIDDDQMALQALQQGAEDYLIKGKSSADLMDRAIRYAIGRAQAAANLRRGEQRYRAIFENASLGIGLIDQEGYLFSRNPALSRMLAENADGNGSRLLFDYVHPDDRKRFESMALSLLKGERDDLSVEIRLTPRAGPAVWGRVNVSSVPNSDGQPSFAVCMVEDITGRKAMEDQLRLAARVLEATSEGIFVTDRDLHIVHANPAFTRLTGFEAADVLGSKPSILASGRHGCDFYASMWHGIKTEGGWRGEIWDRKKSGEIFAIWLNLCAVKNEHGETSHYFAVFSDITSRKLSEERLCHQANHDMLTGLPNRTLFHERLGRALARAERNKLVFAVLFLDLDQFKQINDNLGHLTGDLLLREVAGRLEATVRQQDTVARVGGDEFTLIIEDISDFRDAATVARKVLARVNQSLTLGEHHIKISASVGISLYPKDGGTTAALLHQADEAMYLAKKQGRAAFCFASTGLSEEAFEHDAMKRALQHAILNDELEIHFQPIVSLESGAVYALEALLRWHHPDLGLMIPAQFLPLAVESGLMPVIAERVFHRSIQQLALWRRQYRSDLRLSLNAGQAELQDPAFARAVEDALIESTLPAEAIDLEVSGDLLMDSQADSHQTISRLRQFGCKIALDDLSADQADLHSLSQLPIDVLKLSSTLIRDLPLEGPAEMLTDGAISYAHSHGIRVTGKAIETDEQLSLLRQHHCDYAQGYRFSRPLPGDDLPAFFSANTLAGSMVNPDHRGMV